ncbi:hypothetical protein [Thermotalea metallivorans]|uniref:Uncharacterized protein n=1 Tax=Thermotalea metallivorans TaxID=520762 RepID=A0A140L528_9FIRM|nr:hypothetical protein [Thermotalea metallivorans]KXG75653.1 hypothetical protein AN619_16490 [Thermotalea metallivorans]
MGEEAARQAISLFNMDYLSSVTTMVLAVNLITQVIKEVFLNEKTKEMVPKLIALLASFVVISVHHYTQWVKNPAVFHGSLIEFIFLIFLNSILIAGLAMGNYKVLNLTKDREVRKMREQIGDIEKEVAPRNDSFREEKGELH